VCSNFAWNRYWTFSARDGHARTQAVKFLCVSLLGLGVNLALLAALTGPAGSTTAAQALAVALCTPLTFALNRLWTFRAASCAPVLLDTGELAISTASGIAHGA